MGRACGRYGGQKRCTQDFGGEFKRKRNNSENQGIDGRIVLTWTFKKCDGVGDIDLTHDRDSWWTFMNGVMNLRFPYIAGNF